VNQTSAPRPNRARTVFLAALLILSLATITLGVWLLVNERQQIAEESRPAADDRALSRAPDFELTTPDGEVVRLKDLRGKVVLLNFWATWCPPCKAEMPDLDALHQKYGAEHDFLVLGVNDRENAVDVAAFARRERVNFPLVIDRDGGVIETIFNVRYLPTSMIIDRDGNIRDTWSGQIAREAMLARLQKVW
jgi:cytochrome c biogenesis protein CcmG, thiol:disulfide interchange protein DsbE